MKDMHVLSDEALRTFDMPPDRITAFHAMVKQIHGGTETEVDIADVLTQWGFAEFVDKFEFHEIRDEETLCELQKEDLKFMGINKVGDRLKIMRAIDTFRASGSAYF